MGTTSQTGLGWIGKLSDGWTAKLELYHGMSGVEGGLLELQGDSTSWMLTSRTVGRCGALLRS
jgi:hypothetical protein